MSTLEINKRKFSSNNGIFAINPFAGYLISLYHVNKVFSFGRRTTNINVGTYQKQNV